MKSPNYPLNYPVDQFINYPLTVAEGKAIELTFTSMEIEECQELWIEWGRCPCDYVEVLDSDGSQLMKECSNVVPSPITSTGNTMSVIFYSDYSENMKGFFADWKMVEPAPVVASGADQISQNEAGRSGRGDRVWYSSPPAPQAAPKGPPTLLRPLEIVT